MIDITTEDELSKYMMQIEQYKEQIDQYEYQAQYIQAAINDYNKAKLTLEQIKDIGKNEDMLIPIGGGTFISVKSDDVKNVLTDIGSGLVMQKKSQDGIKNIEKRIEALQKTYQKITETIQGLQNEANAINEKAQEIASK